jgi:dTDP-4-dehydrorhamnose reductase
VKIVDLLGRKIRVIPITSQQLARPAVRPSYSVMDCKKIISEAGFYPRPWEHALKEYLISLEMEEK